MGALVAGPSVSISATTPLLASTRLISPVLSDLLTTVNVWLPVRTVAQSAAQLVAVTVTRVASTSVAPGSSAMTAAAITAGTTTTATATATGRWAISRLTAEGAAGSDGFVGAGACRADRRKAGTTMTR